MLHKIFSVRKLIALFSCHVPSTPVLVTPMVDVGSSLVKIIHVGGIVECYYMPVPAVSIMEKYPSSILTRPHIFKRPWDALVLPEEILMPGERFFVVPRRTVQKLLRRIRQQSTGELSSMSMSFTSGSSTDISGRHASERTKNGYSTEPVAVRSKSEGSIHGSSHKLILQKTHKDANPANTFGSSLVKIIHVGGIVEYHYMAVPAGRIMEKYPLFVLARPHIFRRPWDAVVHPDEMLMPGERFYVVPRRTVQKLQRRIQQEPIGELSSMSMSFTSASSSDISGFSQSSGKSGKKLWKMMMWNPTLAAIHEASLARGVDS